jgi:DNA-binding CsgD family transcriptional regulator/PAS domain-containing protein
LVDDMIAAVYDAAARLVPASRPLELLAKLTDSDKAFAAWFDLERRIGAITASFNVEPHFIDTYGEIYGSENPWLARASYFQAEGLVWRGSEIIQPAQLKETQFFRLFCYGQSIENTAHLVIRVSGAELLHVMLTRRHPSEDYEDDALDICRLYAQHARHAQRIGEALADRDFLKSGFDLAVDDLGVGIAIIRASGAILYANAAFEATMARQDGPRQSGPQHSRLPPLAMGRQTLERRLPRAVADALAKKPVPASCVLHLSADDEKRPVAVRFHPITLRCDLRKQSQEGYVLLFKSADGGAQLDEQALRAGYWLTASEARVCAALVRGENVFGLAQNLGISPQTARTHLKRIFDKTRTTRQPELLQVLMSFAYRKNALGAAAEHERVPLPSNVLSFPADGKTQRSD